MVLIDRPIGNQTFELHQKRRNQFSFIYCDQLTRNSMADTGDTVDDVS